MNLLKSSAFRLSALLAAATLLSPLAIAQTPPAATHAPAAVPPLNGIAHIAIRVKDIAASVAFYHKLGYDQAFANLGRDGVTVTQSFVKLNDRQYIELYPVNPQNPTQDKPEFLHLCFEGADLYAIHDYYVAEGLTPISVRTAAAGNLLFTLKGPMQFADPQNIEYTQYMPGSKHTLEFGKLNGPDRVGDKMTVVVLAMQDPAAARDFYLTKLGFTPSKTNPALLDLPGDSGEAVQIVPVSELGSRASIVLTTPDLDKSAAQLTRQQVEFKRATATAGGHTVDMISVTDPDNNIIRIEAAK